MLHKTLFENKKAAQYINKHYVPVRVMDRAREDGRNKPVVEQLQSRYEVGAFPTLILVSHDLSRAARIVGYVEREKALSLLEKFIAQKP
jgi:thioredoxin-related protein